MAEHDADFHGWATEQAALLRAGRLADADVANIAEEIESMGRSERRELVSRLAVLLQHLLKWQFQPERRGRSWSATIDIQRELLDIHLRDNPSLRPLLEGAMRDAWRLGRRAAAVEAELSLPEANPWSVAQVLDEGFYPA